MTRETYVSESRVARKICPMVSRDKSAIGSDRVEIVCPPRVEAYLSFCLPFTDHLVGLVDKASASRAEDPGFESRLRWDSSGVESYQWLKNWHSSGYPARRLALQGQRWDWLAWCQYTVTGWGRKFDVQLLSQCGSTHNCLSRSVPEIYTSMLLGR